MVPISHVVGWFSGLAERDGETLDPPRLQALTYIAQVLGVALYYEPLFDNPVEAREDGPFVCDLPAPDCQVADLGPPPTHGVEGMVGYIHEHFGALSTDDLERMARDSSAWRAALATGVGTTLSYDDMCEDFHPIIVELAGEPPEPMTYEEAMETLRRDHPDWERKVANARAQLEAGLPTIPHPPIRW